MSIEILLEGNLKPTSDQEKFSAFLQHFCQHQHVKYEDYGPISLIEICPEGVIQCSYENDFVSILVITNIAGPGFHAYVVQFLEAIIEESGVKFNVSDPTGYMEDHDFENLKYEFFYKRLEFISDYVKENASIDKFSFLWPVHYYIPEARVGYAITPMGDIAIKDFLENEVEELAEKIFLWNEYGKHATLYLKCALNLIWKECFFEYSMMNEHTSNTAHMIMDYLEIAHKLDASLPLPTQIYESLAKTLHRESCLSQAIPMKNQDMGYRKRTILYELGNWLIPISGFSEVYQDNKRTGAHITPGYKNNNEIGNWVLKVDVEANKELNPIFNEESEFVIDYKDINNSSLNGKVLINQYEEHCELIAQLMANDDQISFRFLTTDLEAIKIGMDIAEGVQHIHVYKDAKVIH